MGGHGSNGSARIPRTRLSTLALTPPYPFFSRPTWAFPRLHSGIVVKVMAKELKEHGYYKQKVWAWGTRKVGIRGALMRRLPCTGQH